VSAGRGSAGTRAAGGTGGTDGAGPPPLDGAARSRVRDALVDGVAAAVAGAVAGDLVEVSLPVLRRARSRPATLGLPEPAFAWKPAFVRRSLGLAAVRACAEGRFRGPAEAVRPLAEEAVDEWRRTGWRTFHWEPWFAGLDAGARAVVLAGATTWATPMWTAADWAALGPRAVIGGVDDLWTCPGPRTVRLRARYEARVHPTPTPARPDGCGVARAEAGPVLVSVSGGTPGDGWADDLAFLALVAGVHAPDRPVPSRVVGLWPESGLRRTVGIDESVLTAAAGRVASVVAVLAAAPTGRATVSSGTGG
jgi:hypothetical protein